MLCITSYKSILYASIARYKMRGIYLLQLQITDFWLQLYTVCQRHTYYIPYIYSAIMWRGNIGELGKLTDIWQYFMHKIPSPTLPIGTYFHNFVLDLVLELSGCWYTCLLNYCWNHLLVIYLIIGIIKIVAITTLSLAFTFHTS